MLLNFKVICTLVEVFDITQKILTELLLFYKKNYLRKF